MRTARSAWILCTVAAFAACSTSSSNDDRSAGSDPSAPGAPGGPGSSAPPGSSGGGGAPSGGGDDDASEPAVPYVHYDINHVVSTGQSNSVAHGGVPPLTSTQPFENLMFDVGVMTSGDCEAQGCLVYQKPTRFSPLVEGDSFWYPVETMSSGLANEAAMLGKTKYNDAKHALLVSLAGRNGLTYWCLRKGSCNYVSPAYVPPFEESLKQVTDAKALAEAAGKSYVVRVVTAVHGESDDYGYAVGTPEFPLDGSDGTFRALKTYADALIEWQRDYEAAIKAITKQSGSIPLLVSQHSGWNDIPTSAVTQFQYEAHVRSKGKVVLVAPGYVLDYASDCRHYSSDGERRLGEYFAKAYARIVFEGRRWEPVRPKTVTHHGNIVTARFYVPTPPLVLDTERVTNPGDYGFEVVDGAGAKVAIQSVAVTAPDTVTLTLASVPAGAAKLRYAFTGVPHTCPGRFAGPRGNLRDSDTTPSQYGYELFDWAVHFETPIQ